MLYEWAKRQLKREHKRRIYWWEPKQDKPNVGDHVAFDIVSRVLAQHGKEIGDKLCASNKLVSVGSVLHFANTGDTIWGTGVNKKVDDSKHRFSALDVRAVRGPKTQAYLQARGIEVPDVFGDPAILLPFFYPSQLLINDEPRKPYIVINHMNDDMAQYRDHQAQLVTPMQYPGSFIAAIVNSEFVISSSLHGVIIAEAYGVPAVFLDSNSGESMFKYEDYFAGTHRNRVPRVTSIEEGLSVARDTPPDLSAQAEQLYRAFPTDLWGV
ncbi:polysaccharide pyruvyl transferase family protein [Alteromonas sp. ASW11-19]|uniref:Polysaccharide pyruvyl transferase family protein n=1 Tax=Alteromonas salexigens TaxID=2982530 RepID=A0ABT2VUJ7_9ALTE|nr:polysaccharide pyruvyl transferase family protein [Alteromonas salexigens]MCU7556108.1 polysaccharide pyruvyl transferase family protein [Alteromonas salexigens]